MQESQGAVEQSLERERERERPSDKVKGARVYVGRAPWVSWVSWPWAPETPQGGDVAVDTQLGR